MAKTRKAPAERREVPEPQAPASKRRQFVAVPSSISERRLSQTLVIPGEDADELVALRARIESDLRPKGMLENELVDEITACCWRLRRMRSAEAGIIADGISQGPWGRLDPIHLHRYGKELVRLGKWEPTEEEEECVLGVAFYTNKETMSELMVHETSVQLSLQQALRMLERLQQARGGRAVVMTIGANH